MMLGAMIGRLFGARPVPGAPSRLPPELVAAIHAAAVTFRASPDPTDGSDRVYVSLPGVGHFRFDGLTDAAERIGRNWPEVTPQQARHAAVLLAGLVGARNRENLRGLRPARVPRAIQFREFDYDRL